MTIVLVHGNPETEAIWDDLVPHLRNDDVVRLSPPGFGCAIDGRFTQTLPFLCIVDMALRSQGTKSLRKPPEAGALRA